MLDANGDYTFGQGSANFWINSPQGVAQSVQTRLLLWEGEWFLDETSGTPYSQEILGYGTKSLYDLAIRARVLATPGVTSIDSYSSSLNSVSRQLTVSMTITTQFSTESVPVGPVVI
jgi:hypothetical protein